tara:strand:+ start:258 stop:440 length:183 start_codon:yes stop_codon:yes gene_type:complete
MSISNIDIFIGVIVYIKCCGPPRPACARNLIIERGLLKAASASQVTISRPLPSIKALGSA